jgi:hypothetical protein
LRSGEGGEGGRKKQPWTRKRQATSDAQQEARESGKFDFKCCKENGRQSLDGPSFCLSSKLSKKWVIQPLNKGKYKVVF